MIMARNLGRLVSSLPSFATPATRRLACVAAEKPPQPEREKLGEVERSLEGEKKEREDHHRDRDHGDGPVSKAAEVDGPRGLEPTRYGDWEKNGRCYDF